MIEDCTYQELLNAGVRIAVRKSPNTYVLQPEFHVFCKQHLEGEIIPTKRLFRVSKQNRVLCANHQTRIYYVLEPEFHVFCKQDLEGEIIPTKKRKVECLPIGYSVFKTESGLKQHAKTTKKKHFGF